MVIGWEAECRSGGIFSSVSGPRARRVPRLKAVFPQTGPPTMATELEPVFMLLDDVHAAAARIIRRAGEQADEIRQDAGRQAAEIVARAQAQAETARAEAAVQSRALTAAENTRMEAERDRELEELRARAETRMPDYNDRVVAGARALLEEFCEPSGEPRDARR